MSTRVLSDRELLERLRLEVDELRRGLAAVVERLDALAAPLDLDAGRHSRRLELDVDHTPATVRRLREYIAGSSGSWPVAS